MVVICDPILPDLRPLLPTNSLRMTRPTVYINNNKTARAVDVDIKRTCTTGACITRTWIKDTVHDGTSHDGIFHDGAFYDGAFHDGAIHDGAIHDGAADSMLSALHSTAVYNTNWKTFMSTRSGLQRHALAAGIVAATACAHGEYRWWAAT